MKKTVDALPADAPAILLEDKFKTDFDNDNSDNDTNVSFYIDMEK